MASIGKEEARVIPGFFLAENPGRQGPDGSARQRRDKAFEQRHQPLTCHSDGCDDSQGDKAGDEAVFDRGRAALVPQEFSEH